MSRRIRHCVECPECNTCYVISSSPYRNGAYIVPTEASSSEEYTLYCFCSGGRFPSAWKWRETKACVVSKAAHDRGYGTRNEICPITSQSKMRLRLPDTFAMVAPETGANGKKLASNQLFPYHPRDS